MTELSPEQKKAVEFFEPRSVVAAAAGSGKTRVLVAKYLRSALDEKIHPSGILTITFTRKAAAEMRERIVRALTEAREFELAAAAEAGPISTIHSFCEALLREEAWQAELDPGFEVLEEAPATRLKVAAASAAIGTADWNDSRFTVLADSLRSAYNQGRRQFDEALMIDIVRAMDGFRGAGTELEKARAAHESADSVLQAWDRAIDRRMKSIPTIGAQIPSFKDLLKSLGISAGTKFADPESLARLAERISAFGTLVCDAWEKYEEDLWSQGVLDFGGLEREVVSLLKRSAQMREKLSRQFPIALIDEAQDLNPLQVEILGYLEPRQMTWVGDERQSIYGFRNSDVEIFRERVRVWPEMPLSTNYRSDPALVEFIDDVFEEIWPDGTYRRMSIRAPFALDDNPAQSVNAIENGVVTLTVTPQSSSKGPARADALAEEIERIIEEGWAPQDIAILFRTWRPGLEARTALKARGIPVRTEGGATGLLPQLESRDIANALRSIGDPTDDFSLLCVLRGPLVGLSLDGIADLAFIAKRGHEVPLHYIFKARPFQNELDEDKRVRFLKWWGPLSEVGGRMAGWEVISEIIEKGGLYQAMAAWPRAEEAISNVRKLQIMAAENSNDGPLEFSERIRTIEGFSADYAGAATDDPRAPAVLITTIHQSKGLEWPVVVLGDASDSPPGPRDRPRFDPVEVALALPPEGPLAAGEGRRIPLESILIREEIVRAEAESKRLLYVAMTRAKKRLHIMDSESNQAGSFGGLIRKSAVGKALKKRAKPED